jgi:hypothetical protein
LVVRGASESVWCEECIDARSRNVSNAPSITVVVF